MRPLGRARQRVSVKNKRQLKSVLLGSLPMFRGLSGCLQGNMRAASYANLVPQQNLIKKIKRRTFSDDDVALTFLVYFTLDKELPLIGDK